MLDKYITNDDDSTASNQRVAALVGALAPLAIDLVGNLLGGNSKLLLYIVLHVYKLLTMFLKNNHNQYNSKVQHNLLLVRSIRIRRVI